MVNCFPSAVRRVYNDIMFYFTTIKSFNLGEQTQKFEDHDEEGLKAAVEQVFKAVIANEMVSFKVTKA
jgi:hypothetical protein